MSASLRMAAAAAVNCRSSMAVTSDGGEGERRTEDAGVVEVITTLSTPDPPPPHFGDSPAQLVPILLRAVTMRCGRPSRRLGVRVYNVKSARQAIARLAPRTLPPPPATAGGLQCGRDTGKEMRTKGKRACLIAVAREVQAESCHVGAEPLGLCPAGRQDEDVRPTGGGRRKCQLDQRGTRQ